MKKIYFTLLLFGIFGLSLWSNELADSLKLEIESLPFSYLKGDKIWDLALLQGNELNQPEESIKNYLKATEMFVEMDSLASAIKTNSSVFIMAFNNPEYFEYSKEAFPRHLTFLDNEKLQSYKTKLLRDMQIHLNNAYFLKDMDHLQEGLLLIEKYFDDRKNDSMKIDFDHLQILTINHFYGEEKALNKSMEIYKAIENGDYNLNFGKKNIMRVKILSVMQNIYYYRGDIDQSNQILDQAKTIAFDVYTNYTDSLSVYEKNDLRSDIAQLMTLKTDNLEIKEENLTAIETGYLDVNKFAKAFDKDREVNNYVKIAHAYDVVFSGKHRKINYYLTKAENEIELVSNSLFVTNFYLTKARYLLNVKDYETADLCFLEVEKFIDKTNQSWIKFNYILERSRYYFETNQPKIGYDMVTKFYKNIDKDFSNDIAEKTAELNNLLATQELKSDKIKLEKELEIKSLKSSRETLVTTLVGIVLGFTSLLLINNVRLNKKLKYSLTTQSETLQKEMIISQKRAEELIVTEKLSTTGQIASSIAHEIKNPLTNIITASKLLKHSNNQEEIDKYYQICERNSWLAIDKVNALLEYAKQKKMNFQDSYLKTVLKDAYSLTKGSLENKNIQLDLIYKTHDDMVRIDQKEIAGVIVNIILNSIQAMGEDQENKLIEVILSKENNNFIIEITDNGAGIPQEILSEVFNPFFTTKEKGTGLGLNYAQKVLIEHYGKIEIKSQVNKGTHVIIKLPDNLI